MSQPEDSGTLSEFLRTHADEILLGWDEFAATLEHDGAPLDHQALRDHAAEILAAIAADMEQPQSDRQQRAKSRGESDPLAGAPDTAAETHADTRITSGFAIGPMVTEYRALRASVLRLWAKQPHAGSNDELREVTRFNEAIDQALVESVSRYTEQTGRATDLFIGVLGHDIRNPLGTIRMAVHNLVRTGKLDAAQARPLTNSVNRISSLIEQVVDFTRGQAGARMPIATAPMDLAALAREIVEETQIRHPEVSIGVEIGDGSFAGAWDRGRMGQLLSNLLANAVQHGDRTRPISVTLADRGAAVTLQVRNHGNVIPAAECLRIFDPLVRGTGADGEAPPPEGLGLGLFICREIVRAHGGSIEVRSSAAEGTRFVVDLPRTAATA